VAKERTEMVRFAFNLARGKWRENSQVEIYEADEVEMKLLSSHKRFRSVIDGEVFPLKPTTRFKIHKKALQVLVPSAAEGVKAA
jgi:diacylglycerol kinase family enzyme